MTTAMGVYLYEVTLYHDEPEDANTDSRGVEGWFQSEDAAVHGARAHLTDYWQTASIHGGDYFAGTPGIRPDRFVVDERYTPLRVGRDWTER